jgi:hypothetical protein
MQTFRVLVRGRGMVIRRWFFFRRTLDLYATRFVEAEGPEAAGVGALEELRGEPRLAAAALRAPSLAIEEVEVVEARASTLPQPGIVFFPPNSTVGT